MSNLKKYSTYLLLPPLIAAIVLAIVIKIYNSYQFWDDDALRGAEVIQQSKFDDNFEKVYPSPDFDDWDTAKNWQGWSTNDSMWYYNTTQGSDLLPYDLFMELEQIDSEELFRSAQNIDRYRYIPQRATFSNKDGLPLGLVKDTYKGKDYVGFTCAACHTNQIVYNKVAIRVDGAPSMADLDSFMISLQKTIEHTLKAPEKLTRISKRIITRGHYDSEAEVKKALADTALDLLLYNSMNHSKTKYGYARLDAFGRIFNRVLQHVFNKDQMEKVLREVLSQDDVNKVLKNIDTAVISKQQFDHLFTRIQPLLTNKQQVKLRNAIFNSPNAPVSYPFLWDTPQHDYVQWNGLANNAGVGPIGRNSGEVIGVFGTLDWQEKPGTNVLGNLLGGQNTSGNHISFESSIDVNNLRRLESQLGTLESPLWPETVLPKVDQEKATRGDHIFDQYCAGCHLPIDRKSPTRRVIAQLDKLSSVKTDPTMSENSTGYVGRSGILQGNYVDVGVGKLYVQEQMPVATLLTSATTNVVLTPDPDKYFFQRWFDWANNLAKTFFNNEVKSSLKQGNHDPATLTAPYADLASYKGRSLNGIWATAPYLHNGSVPTLYDLLLPKKRAGDAEDGEYRPDTFRVGSRLFDPEKVGFVTNKNGFVFDTSLPANDNGGHEYAAGRTPQRNGKILPALTKQQRLDLLEYLKTL